MENNRLVLFTSNEGKVTADVRIAQDTVWLSLNQLSTLFGRDKSVISRHLKNIFSDGELAADATVAFFATVQYEGERTIIVVGIVKTILDSMLRYKILR